MPDDPPFILLIAIFSSLSLSSPSPSPSLAAAGMRTLLAPPSAVAVHQSRARPNLQPCAGSMGRACWATTWQSLTASTAIKDQMTAAPLCIDIQHRVSGILFPPTRGRSSFCFLNACRTTPHPQHCNSYPAERVTVVSNAKIGVRQSQLNALARGAMWKWLSCQEAPRASSLAPPRHQICGSWWTA